MVTWRQSLQAMGETGTCKYCYLQDFAGAALNINMNVQDYVVYICTGKCSISFPWHDGCS